jgi:hypothetical protein
MFFKKIHAYEYACANWKNFALSIAVDILASVVLCALGYAACLGVIWLVSSFRF